MHPAPSVILFTVLSGAGFGYLAGLALGLQAVAGFAAVLAWGLGYALAVAGLVASTFHLGNPQRALLAFSQWRTSWLSREAWAATLALVVLAPAALADILGWPVRWVFALPGAALCLATVACTAMIYAQIRAVPRWHHWTTPLVFLAFALTGGAILAARPEAPVAAALLAIVLALAFRLGDTRFARAGESIGTATALAGLGRVTVFEWPHTGDNYLLREMIHVVGRRHAAKLRSIALLAAGVAPAAILAVAADWRATAAAFALHLVGAFAARWLFFAEAEHVVGLYYGRR
jgi:DMSO reductase anchor subunit